ncbi:hypothetical protein P175DRAFT_0530443 [Aspergillus ochraceoroseus IBT 24754]|uniref:ABC transporter domain-containing protein n=1 Tax=Aspergillus ochraceoroseus IBT 24754 TaxID=1392256 RepID=A0A2T5M473_9EURO|nr:uncharacterized protein P175DRAFT_0530443 [Aspergillus ochraceoroseus IBT 24754]PTU23333.1 hypothetical protein P175DRAFT_0530443 [Aspergillus ochraceoroseus IBT 24754]
MAAKPTCGNKHLSPEGMKLTFHIRLQGNTSLLCSKSELCQLGAGINEAGIHPGQLAALVGSSASGKSTIILLIERVYTPTSGTIETVLFDGTIRFNLELGARPGQIATQADIEEACRLVNVHEAIMGLLDGYETACGPNGDWLEKAARNITVIAIAHRIYTIWKADVIFLIEEGRYIEKGAHTELSE